MLLEFVRFTSVQAGAALRSPSIATSPRHFYEPLQHTFFLLAAASADTLQVSSTAPPRLLHTDTRRIGPEQLQGVQH